MSQVLGIDVGATGIKGAIVDLDKGELVGERHKIPTPEGGKPDDIIRVIKEIVNHFDWQGKPVGLGFPAVVMNGKTLTASNVDKSWIGYPIEEALSKALGINVPVLNDADAAGQAEIVYGNGKDMKGTVILLTLGTGIGSALFKDGALLKNTELGTIIYKGKIAEKLVSNAARKREDMSWEEYGDALGGYLRYITKLFYPDQIILGGGISKKFEKFSTQFSDLKNVSPATQFNNAGIVGAALAVR